MKYPIFMKSVLILANLICLIVSIITFSIGSNRWHEFIGSTITLLVAIWGFIVSCQINQCLLLSFSVLSAIDFLTSLGNSILMIIVTIRWKKFCRGELYFDDYSSWTCHDLIYKGHWGFVYAEIVALLIGVISRVFTTLSSFFMVRYYFNYADDDKRNDDD